MIFQRVGRFVPFLVLVVSLAGCATVGPDYERPDVVDTPDGWIAAREAAGLQAGAPADLSAWWQTLDDPILSDLIDRAIDNNLDLQAAAARVRQARAQRGISAADRFPTIQTDTSATRNRTSENVDTVGAGTSTLYSAEFDASWEVDVFGGTRRAVEAAEADVAAEREALNDTLVSVLAEVALNYIEVRTFQARLAIARANLDAQTETYELVQSRFEAGFETELELEQARTNVESTRAEIPTLETSLAAAKNRLTTLLGTTPGALESSLANVEPVPEAPITVAVGVPADTIRRRPDIRQAERQLAAETARIGQETAELYPKLSLPGSIGLESLQSGNLFSAASGVFSIIPTISWTVFDAGRIRNTITAQTALQEETLANYENTVLEALEDVENTLTAYTNEQLRNHALREAATSAANAARTARERYDGGLVDFLDVLDAERTRLSAQDSLAVSNADIVSNLVSLYKALGGGWESIRAAQPTDPQDQDAPVAN